MKEPTILDRTFHFILWRMMRKPPEKPTSLRPKGEKITLPKPILIIDSMQQKPYSFKPFQKWFADILLRRLAADREMVNIFLD